MLVIYQFLLDCSDDGKCRSTLNDPGSGGGGSIYGTVCILLESLQRARIIQNIIPIRGCQDLISDFPWPERPKRDR